MIPLKLQRRIVISCWVGVVGCLIVGALPLDASGQITEPQQAMSDVQPRTPEQVVKLFKGADLEGWYSFLRSRGRNDPQQVFSVVDGQLRISGNGWGYLSTQQAWRDYQLTLEYRWGEKNWGVRQTKARDAGLFLHSAGPDGNSEDGAGAFKAAIECQIMEGATGDFLLIRGRDEAGEPIHPKLTATVAAERDQDDWFTYAPRGGLTQLSRWGRVNWQHKDPNWQDRFGFRGAEDVEKPLGEWNRLEVRCAADTIEVKLNGRLINRAKNVFPQDGPILLQCEGSEIFFRHIELAPLESVQH